MGTRLSCLAGAWLLAGLLTAGCSKRESSPPTNSSPGDTNVPAAPTRGPGASTRPGSGAVIPDSGNAEATLTALTSELRKYVIESRSVPKDFEEFIARSHVQAPAPPAGKKYVIKNQAVVLVKR